ERMSGHRWSGPCSSASIGHTLSSASLVSKPSRTSLFPSPAPSKLGFRGMRWPAGAHLAESSRMPRGVKEGSKRERQYEHIKESYQERGVSTDEAQERAARTVNKVRREHGETKSQRSRKRGKS